MWAFLGVQEAVLDAAGTCMDLDPLAGERFRDGTEVERGTINSAFLSEHDGSLNGIRGKARVDRALERAEREWDRP